MSVTLNKKLIEEKKIIRDAIQGLIEDGTLKDTDHYYGINSIKGIKGTKDKEEKKILTLSGAEYLSQIFGLTVRIEIEKDLSDPSANLVDVTAKAIVYDNDKFLGEWLGNCNSLEEKFGFEWKEEKDIPSSVSKSTLQKEQRSSIISVPEFVYNKGVFKTLEQDSIYGKPQEHWDALIGAVENGTAIKSVKKVTKFYETSLSVTKYKLPVNAGDKKNTILKMAVKRAFVSAVKSVLNASSFFTVDLEEGIKEEDYKSNPQVISPSVPHVQVHQPEAPKNLKYYPILQNSIVVTKLRRAYPDELDSFNNIDIFISGFLKKILELPDKQIILSKLCYVTNSTDLDKKITDLGFKPFTIKQLEEVKELLEANNIEEIKTIEHSNVFKKYLQDNGFFDVS